jgi:hypothetical protein
MLADNSLNNIKSNIMLLNLIVFSQSQSAYNIVETVRLNISTII